MPISEFGASDFIHIFKVERFRLGVVREAAKKSWVHEPPVLRMETSPEGCIAFFIRYLAILDEGLAQDKEALVVGPYIVFINHARF